MSRKVIYTKFHQDLFVPGLGGVGFTLPSTAKSFDLNMFTSEHGLMLELSFRGLKFDVVVPYANVVLMQLAPEEVKPAAKNKASA